MHYAAVSALSIAIAIAPIPRFTAISAAPQLPPGFALEDSSYPLELPPIKAGPSKQDEYDREKALRNAAANATATAQNEPQRAEEPKLMKSSSAQKKTVPGDRGTWMAQAGISAGDMRYADYIVTMESGWNPIALNPSSGACSLVQALPCSKIGPNWKDPVQALLWASGYVSQRYGGWQQAAAFWQLHRWY